MLIRLYPLPVPSKSENYTTQQISSIATEITQENNTASLFQGVLITREGLSSYLEAVLEEYGMSDKYDTIAYIINGESSWRWWAYNKKSAGLLAFTADTWKDKCLKFGVYDLNPFHQIDCGVKLMSEGEWYRWDVFCYKQYDEKCVKLRHLYPQ